MQGLQERAVAEKKGQVRKCKQKPEPQYHMGNNTQQMHHGLKAALRDMRALTGAQLACHRSYTTAADEESMKSTHHSPTGVFLVLAAANLQPSVPHWA